ncbi:MAG: hypothetical protein PHS44_08275 [Candidatus Dojkabacteria bacterium]|jgi:hypothetical protein|nr:hypothetical protein [Candidatus Dojkabacteria bacterium]
METDKFHELSIRAVQMGYSMEHVSRSAELIVIDSSEVNMRLQILASVLPTSEYETVMGFIDVTNKADIVLQMAWVFGYRTPEDFNKTFRAMAEAAERGNFEIVRINLLGVLIDLREAQQQFVQQYEELLGGELSACDAADVILRDLSVSYTRGLGKISIMAYRVSAIAPELPGKVEEHAKQSLLSWATGVLRTKETGYSKIPSIIADKLYTAVYISRVLSSTEERELARILKTSLGTIDN